MNRTSRDLALGLVLAALLVYLLQVALFRSWVGPFIIMLTVPLGLIGVLGMLSSWLIKQAGAWCMPWLRAGGVAG